MKECPECGCNFKKKEEVLLKKRIKKIMKESKESIKNFTLKLENKIKEM